MWKINYRRPSFLRLDYKWLIAAALLSLLALSWLSIDPLLLRLVPINKSSLTPLGRVLLTEGVIQRKVFNDSFEIPILSGDPVFDGDLLDSTQGGRGELSLGSGLSLIVPVGTKLQMNLEDQQWQFHLMQGYVLFRSLGPHTVRFNTGLQSQSLELQDGLTFVRPTIEGVVAELATGDQLMQPLLEEINHMINKRYPMDRIFAVVDASEVWAKKESFGDPQDVSADKLRLGASRVPSTFPQPENKIVFLMNAPDTIRIAARPLCEDQCELTIRQDRRVIVQETFLRGQRPVHELTVDSMTASKFEWTFTDDAYKETFEFKVLPFTEENFQKILSQGSNIEIR